MTIESDRYLKGHKIGRNKARDSSTGGDSGMSNMGMLAKSHSKTIDSATILGTSQEALIIYKAFEWQKYAGPCCNISHQI